MLTVFKSAKSFSWWAVVVAQLVERSLPTPEIRGSNPNIGKLYLPIVHWKDENKEKEAGNGPFLKKKKVFLLALSGPISSFEFRAVIIIFFLISVQSKRCFRRLLFWVSFRVTMASRPGRQLFRRKFLKASRSSAEASSKTQTRNCTFQFWTLYFKIPNLCLLFGFS